MNIAKGGLLWIFSSFFVTLLVFLLTFFFNGFLKYFLLFISVLLILVSIMLIVFFRDPDRNIGNDIVAVADGKIREISNVKDKDIGECIKISTFMNIHNVHVNRMPISGKTLSIDHYKGKHIPAFKKESEKNERVVSIIKTDIGKIKIIQIAGTVARRIVPYFKQNEYIEKGEKIGLIRMGSRVDLYLPTKIVKTITISVNDRLKAGESTVAKLND